MINLIKRLFGKREEKKHTPPPHSRTFNKVLTGRYFGCEDVNADASKIALAKQDKIEQIRELGLKPMYVKYIYKTTKEEDSYTKIVSAHVTFQKEILAKKRNMIDITEISFTVNHDDIDEFEQMLGLSLSEDFRDLTQNNEITEQKREEVRKEVDTEVSKKTKRKRRRRSI